MHLTAGVSGLIGTYICGPRLLLYDKKTVNDYLCDEENFHSDNSSDSEDHDVEDGEVIGSMKSSKSKKDRV